MSTDDIHWMSAEALSAAYRKKALSPVEVAEYLLGRIEALDSSVNAFCLLDQETTLEQAESSAERWTRGEPLSPLDGVPVGIKDLLITKGWPTLRGSKTIDKAGPWDADAPSVARLREAGAVFIGKTTTPEFGWKGSTDSPLTGITRNPWNKNKTPGGSSGGSSAALAAGFAPLTLGTDGGGSIRIPAAFTGTFGLKPSFGRVPAFPLSPFGTVAHVGPMTRTVTDAVMLLNVIAKPDARDWTSLPYQPTDYTKDLANGIKGARIAYSPRLGFAPHVMKDVEEAVLNAAFAFEKLGAHVEQIDKVMAADPSPTFRTLWWSGASFALGDLPPEKFKLVDPGLQSMVNQGKEFTKAQYLKANSDRGALGSAFRQFMEKYDFVLTPGVATTAFDVGKLNPLDDDGNAWMSWTPFSYPFNLTQNPAACVPCGFGKDGLPISIQIVGKMFDDAGVLRAARAYEQMNPLFEKHPQEM